MAGILTVTVTYNGMKWIERCLRSVQSSATPTDLMVIDNASEDGTADWVRQHYPDCILVENKENIGFAAANNTGLRYALTKGYSYVYLLNQDAWIFPETIGTLVRAHVEQGRDTGILSPMQMEAGMTRMDAQFRKHCGKFLESDREEVVKVPFVMAAHWLLSRSCIETVGAFSPGFPHYGEDNDYINRAAWHGFSAVVVKSATAVHDRQERPRSKQYRMNLKCVNARVRIADPGRNPLTGLIGQSVQLALQGVLHLSDIPWKGISALRTSYKELKGYRKQAQGRGAFL